VGVLDMSATTGPTVPVPNDEEDDGTCVAVSGTIIGKGNRSAW
jgi:hypothetical protein